MYLFYRALPDVFHIKFVEMRVPAVVAAGTEVVAPDDNLVRPGHAAVLAWRLSLELPNIIAADRRFEMAALCHLFIFRNKNPRRRTVGADHLRLGGDRLDDLVGLMAAVIADSPVLHKNKFLTHDALYILVWLKGAVPKNSSCNAPNCCLRAAG